MGEIETVLPKFDIYIYTTEACNKCRMLKDFISDNGMIYTEKDANKYYDEIADS
jgi:arsenate reductase-like glutaredoxin family protein